MGIAAKVYIFRHEWTHEHYTVLATFDGEWDEIPPHQEAAARGAAEPLAEEKLAGPVELVEVLEWSASELAIRTGMMAKGIMPELN